MPGQAYTTGINVIILDLGCFDEMLDFITLQNKIKYQKAKNSKITVK